MKYLLIFSLLIFTGFCTSSAQTKRKDEGNIGLINEEDLWLVKYGFVK